MAFGIICEYNPFHNGHLYQINKIKERSDEPIICVMSGNFTQRGELAVADKYTRAAIAIRGGADLVLELPFPFCTSSAEFFAQAGMSILSSCGVDKLSFGSECADAEKLYILARVASSEEFLAAYSEKAKSAGNAKAYFDTLSALSGKETQISSNDILGIEYIKAIIKNGYDITPYPIKRTGAEYTDPALTDGQNPSATAVRGELFYGNVENIKDFVPTVCYDVLKQGDIANIKNIERGILLSLRLLKEEDCERIAVNDTGLVNRIIQCAKDASSYSELEEKVRCKKYTDSAIRRAMLYMLTGVTSDDLKRGPAYTNLLAANERGRAILSEIRKKEMSVPIVTKPADATDLKGAAAQRQAELSLRADAIYSLASTKAMPSAEYIKKKPIII